MKKALTSIVILALLLTGCGGSKESGKTPASQPSKQASQVATALPGNQAALAVALGQTGAFAVQIVTVSDIGGADKEEYLDQLLAQRKWPEANMLVLAIYTKDNYDIRFAMGTDFTEQKVTVDEMLGFIRSSYLPKARQEDPAGGLADLIRTVAQRMGK